MNRPWILPTLIAFLIISLVCCMCVLLTLAAGLLIWNQPVVSVDVPPSEEISEVVSTPTRRPTTTPRPTRTPKPGEPPPTARPTPSAPPNLAEAADETLKTLHEAVVPINDPADIARRLEGKTGISPTLEPPSAPRQVGEQDTFWVLDTDENDNFQVDTTLQYVTDHAYFWIEDGVDFSSRDLRDLAQTFENKIYPTNREFFGSEWTPGVDGDEHIYILYATGVGSGIAGYFSTIDSVNPEIQEFSNGHEMFVFNADIVDLGEAYTYGTLAHEFQHMIHWYRDRNEDTWMNEGLSDLAMLLNDYSIGGHDIAYAMQPDLQLNDWPNDPSATAPHYGAAFLFVNYFLNRFGEQATQALVAHPGNGLDSIDQVLRELSITDPITGQPVTADDVFADWVVTNYLLDGSVGDGRFSYPNYRSAPQPDETEQVNLCTDDWRQRQVSQYGVDYIAIGCNQDVTLRFEGGTQVNVVPEDAFSGVYSFWSNKGDESDMTLTQSFDFSAHSGPLTLRYWTWFDIEENWDYLYLMVSTDGENWQLLTTPAGTDENPLGNNYGWGYTGLSGMGPAWVLEEVDISQLAGQEVQLRFEYITDGAVNGEGLLVDDIEIPETGYFTDFEDDDGGWVAEGFVRIQNVLPQTFRLALIQYGRPVTVEYVTLDADNQVEIPLELGGSLNEVVLVVSGTTRFTRQPATYRFTFTP